MTEERQTTCRRRRPPPRIGWPRQNRAGDRPASAGSAPRRRSLGRAQTVSRRPKRWHPTTNHTKEELP